MKKKKVANKMAKLGENKMRKKQKGKRDGKKPLCRLSNHLEISVFLAEYHR